MSFTVSNTLYAQAVIEMGAHSSSPKTEVTFNSDETSFFANNTSAILPLLSNMLNQDAIYQSANSFEALRRNSAFYPNESLISRFLSFDSAK